MLAVVLVIGQAINPIKVTRDVYGSTLHSKSHYSPCFGKISDLGFQIRKNVRINLRIWIAISENIRKICEYFFCHNLPVEIR